MGIFLIDRDLATLAIKSAEAYRSIREAAPRYRGLLVPIGATNEWADLVKTWHELGVSYGFDPDKVQWIDSVTGEIILKEGKNGLPGMD